MTLIVDTVHGSKNSRLIQVGMDQNPYYGTCEEEPIYRLRQILNHLLVEGYLFLTDDKYPVLELTEKSEEILNGGTLLMKTAKEQPKKIKEKKPKKRLLADGGRGGTTTSLKNSEGFAWSLRKKTGCRLILFSRIRL